MKMKTPSVSFAKTMAAKEKTAEANFMAQENQQFRIEAVRNKMLAIHLAALLGKDALSIPDFISEIIAADLEEPGSEDLIRKLHQVSEDNDLKMSRDQIIALIDHFENEARNLLTCALPPQRQTGTAP